MNEIAVTETKGSTLASRNVVNAHQDSMNPNRRYIGFNDPRVFDRSPSPSGKSLIKLASVSALALLSLIGTPSPTWGQQQEEKAHQTQEHSTRTKSVNRGNERGREGRGRITEAHFNERFGNGHQFRINEGEFNAGFFGYGGYEFGFLEPWPVAWTYGDNVYVDYVDGGYVLINPMYPGVTLGLTLR